MSSFVTPRRIAPVALVLLRSLVALALVSCVVGCAQDVRQDVFTTVNSQQVENDVKNSTTLSDADKAAFDSALQRLGYQPYGKTVAAIISDQRTYEQQEMQRAATLRRELNQDVEIGRASCRERV